MPLTRSFSLGVIIASFVVCLGARQLEQIPSPAMPKGSGTIIGIVLDPDGHPAAGAAVSLTTHFPAAAFSQGMGYAPMKTATDRGGRFNFTDVTQEAVELHAVMPGNPEVVYGQVRPGLPGTPIRLRLGERLVVTLRASRGSTMSGRVTGPAGEPARGFTVVVARMISIGETAFFGPGPQTTTDDRGEYRVDGLAPGEYGVWGYFALESGALLPGTEDLCSERRTMIKAAEDRDGIDLAWRLEPVTTVTGSIRDAEGRPVSGASVWLKSPSSCRGESAAVESDADGAFELTRVASGSYTLEALWRSPTTTWWGRAAISSNGRTPQRLPVITLERGGSVSGRFEFISAPNAVPPSGRFTTFLSRVDGEFSADVRGVPSINASDTFEFPSAPEGVYEIRPYPGSGWMARSEMVEGRDALDFPFTLRSGQHRDVVVTFSTRFTDLSGTVTDAQGTPSTAHTMVVFASDDRFWTPRSRRILVERPDNHGWYQFLGLPGGEYSVALAPPDLDARRPSASTLRNLRASAKRVTLSDGARAIVNFQVGAQGR